MLTPAAGLQTHIWNNNLKSLAMLGLYPLLVLGMAWVALYVFMALGGNPNAAPEFASSMTAQYTPIIIAGVAIWFTIAFFFHTPMIRKLSHSHPVTRKEEPELYNLLENLSIAAGVPMPRLEIIETHARNAFASGIDQKSYTVTVTRGLMNSLAKDELEAVLAHELTHIINRDVRLLIITIIFTGMIGFAAQMIWSNIRYGFVFNGNSRKNGGGIIFILALAAVLWLGYLATLFTRFAISRKREYMADAGAVQLTKNPDAMMRALQRIARRDHMPAATGDIAMMCIENSKPFMGLFATHPPIEKRIQSLSAMTNTPVPKISLPPAEIHKTLRQKGQNPWLTRERGRRFR